MNTDKGAPNDYMAQNERHWAYWRGKNLEKEKGMKVCKVCGFRLCTCQSVLGDFKE